MTVVTVNASVFPSGERTPAPTRAILYQSSGLKARPEDCAASAVEPSSRAAMTRGRMFFMVGVPNSMGASRDERHPNLRAEGAGRCTPGEEAGGRRRGGC